MKKLKHLVTSVLAVSAIMAGPLGASAATYDVFISADSGPGSLRQAIAASNATGGTNTIRIWADSFIVLSSGELLITNHVYLVSMSLCVLQANYSSRVL